MKLMNFFNYYILAILFCLTFTECETDNYEAPDCTIEGKIFDHLNQPFQVNQGASIIRIREVSWAKDSTMYTANRTLKVQQDGTYRNTKIFKGTYRLLPYSGAFFPYDDVNSDNDDAGELVEINGTATQDFTVTPYLTIEWVQKPVVDSEGYLNCSVKFTRNQKQGYEMPDLRQGKLHVSRSVNAGAADGSLFTAPFNITNDMEGQELTFRTDIPVKYTGIDYWIRVSMNCQTAAGKPETNYPGMGADNFTTIEKIHVP
ncbi:MAG: DUF3823 domain-containing protein [Tannerella sp.]|jgi:hypothetical protein|nr:DUF3823 domain-containing protein [Tannerella sp.]